MMPPNEFVIVGVPQLSVAVAAPGPGTPEGLQPRFDPVGQKVNDGGVTSTTLTTWVHTNGAHPIHVNVLWIVYEPQVVPELTVTVGLVVDRTIDALLVLLISVQL